VSSFLEGAGLDSVTLALGTALAGAIATRTWQPVRDAVVGLWSRVSPENAHCIGTELNELREQIPRAHHAGGTDTETVLE